MLFSAFDKPRWMQHMLRSSRPEIKLLFFAVKNRGWKKKTKKKPVVFFFKLSTKMSLVLIPTVMWINPQNKGMEQIFVINISINLREITLAKRRFLRRRTLFTSVFDALNSSECRVTNRNVPDNGNRNNYHHGDRWGIWSLKHLTVSCRLLCHQTPFYF